MSVERKSSKRKAPVTIAAKQPSSSSNVDERMCQVHRCRFLDWKPRAVTCLAFNADATTLAVGRENGDIELWNVGCGWLCERVLPGSGESTVQSLMWRREGARDRLFSAGIHGLVIEWDLFKLVPKYSSDSFGGAVWAACLRASSGGNGKELALACEDGSVRLFDAEEDYQAPQYTKALTGHQARVLSVDWRDDVLVSGGADSTIIVWNPKEGTQRSVISVDTSKKEKTLVWQVKLLANMGVVSGDSLGRVSFWDGHFGTLVQSFSQHQSDVLCLSSLDGGRGVVASGADAQIAEFNFVGFDDANKEDGKWVLTASQRSHTHDVYAITAHSRPAGESTHESRNLVVSGGLDTQLCVFSGGLRRRPVKVMPFAFQSPVTVAPMLGEAEKKASEDRAMHFLVQLEKRLQLWRLGELPSPAPEEEEAWMDKAALSGGSYRQVLDIETCAEGQGLNLTCSALAADSSWVIASSPIACKLYHLSWASESRQGAPTVKLVDTKKLLPPLSRACFTQDSKRVIGAGLDGVVRVFDLAEKVVVATFDAHASKTDDDDDDDDGAGAVGQGFIQSLVVSADGRWLASGDHRHHLHVYDLQALKYHCALPVASTAHTALAFSPSEAQLVIVYASNEVWEFDLEEKRISEWTRDHKGSLPAALHSPDKVFSISFNPSKPRCVLLAAHGFMAHLDMSKDKSAATKSAPKSPSAKGAHLLKSSDNEVVSDNCRVVKRFKPLLAAGFVAEDRLLVVEVPWIRVLNDLPAALYRHKFGT